MRKRGCEVAVLMDAPPMVLVWQFAVLAHDVDFSLQAGVGHRRNARRRPPLRYRDADFREGPTDGDANGRVASVSVSVALVDVRIAVALLSSPGQCGRKTFVRFARRHAIEPWR